MYAPVPRLNVGAASSEPPAVASPVFPITVWTAAEPPVPSVSLLPFVTVPRMSRAFNVTTFAVPPSVRPEGLSTVSPSSGLVTAPVPLQVCASVSLTNASVLPALVPVSVPLFVNVAPVTVSGRAPRLSVQPVLIVTPGVWLAALPANSVAVLAFVVLSTTRLGISPAIWKPKFVAVAAEPTCSVPPVIETVPAFTL